jgi:signal transduction histidine kinase
VAGVVVRNYPQTTAARKKALKIHHANTVDVADLEAVAARVTELDLARESEILAEKRGIIETYRNSPEFAADVSELLRPSLEQTFAQIHDYRQLVSQIVQHVNVFLETKHPGIELDAQLDKVNTNIRSIYWAARLMEFKLQSAAFVANPDLIDDPRNKRVFRLHGAVHKYLQIYKPLLEGRRLKLRVTGESHGNLMENPDAVGAIPQAFIDNAIKYAPDDSEIRVHYAETETHIVVEVESLGPRIAHDEHAKIFELFFRGAAARRRPEEGTGFGLGLAKLVAMRIGADLKVSQEKTATMDDLHLTSFAAFFAKPLADDRPPQIVNARQRSRGGVSLIRPGR